MIKKYNNFLLEQALYSINESEVVYSKQFKKLLKGIESPISTYLSEIETTDINVASNFFDISDNKDTISFIADRKATEIIGDNKGKYVTHTEGSILTHNVEANGYIFTPLGYEPKGSQGYQPDPGERGEVISKTTTKNGKTFLYVKFPDGECVINQDKVSYDDSFPDVWTKNRQSVRTGRGVKAILNAAKKKYTDAEIEDFVNKYKSAFDRMNDVFNSFELVKGSDIAKWYRHGNYDQGRSMGTLGNSCMASVNSDYFDIYVDNPDVCNLLILKNDEDNKIKGRALVWYLKKPSGVTFVDRVYTHNDSDIQLFRDYCKFKNWAYKKRNDSSDDPCIVLPDGTTKNYDELSVTIKSGEYDRYPYVDTLKYYNEDSGKLSTDPDNGVGLESTNGGTNNHDGDGGCDRCDGSGRVDCYDCDGDGRQECSNCDGDRDVDCEECDGLSTIKCKECNGTGDVDGEECIDCDGEGKIKCKDCKATGKVECSTCDGSGKEECHTCDGDGTTDCPECQ